MSTQLGTTTPAPDVRAAYEHCEQVTKTQARNFSYGIMLLPGDKRRALSAVYAYARRIDDIGDGDLPPAEQADRAGGGPRGDRRPDHGRRPARRRPRAAGPGRRGAPDRRSRWPPSVS